jgi:hypothetical protein
MAVDADRAGPTVSEPGEPRVTRPGVVGPGPLYAAGRDDELNDTSCAEERYVAVQLHAKLALDLAYLSDRRLTTDLGLVAQALSIRWLRRHNTACPGVGWPRRVPSRPPATAPAASCAPRDRVEHPAEAAQELLLVPDPVQLPTGHAMALTDVRQCLVTVHDVGTGREVVLHRIVGVRGER